MNDHPMILSVLVTSILFTPITMASQNSASSQLQKLFEDDWEFQLKENPLFATEFGDRRFNDKLSKVSLMEQERIHSQTLTFLKRLQAIDRNGLSLDDQLNYDLFEREKKNEIVEYDFLTHLMPITNRSGFHTYFPQLPERIPLKSVEDFENYISRLKAFKTYSEEHVQLMREGIKKGIVLPRIVLEGVEGSIEPHIVEDAEKSLLYKPFENFPDHFSPSEKKRLAQKGRESIRQSVVPGYREFLEFMTKEYIPSARQEISASSLPNGRAFYEHRVRRFTTLELSPKEIHEKGHSEVKRIRNEMEEIIQKVGFKGDFQEFLRFLRTDERFYVETPKALMEEVSLVLKKMDGELPRLFKTLPRTPYGIKEIPLYIAPKTTTAYYDGPSGDGTRAGFYYVNTYDLKSRPLYEIEALSLHEAVPGHHLQIALQQELKEVPNFRRFSGFTAFVEGWGLYAERLGLEVGFYEDPYSNFGRLTYEMWRACRLVVDTGIHYFGWTRQQAIDFMAENTALTLHNITTEVDRYIAWPGQALAYKIGELKIRELRAMAEKELGEKFDIREFHDVVLKNGAVPLDVLDEKVKEWMEDVLD